MRHLWPIALVLWVGCRPSHPAASAGDPTDISDRADEERDKESDELELSNQNKGGGRSRSKRSSAPARDTGGGRDAGGDDQRKRAVAGSFERPVMTCGPVDSYAYVAREFRCADGRNPLGGQIRSAQEARTGSRPHPSGHIIDLYQVPCSGGAETVFVDMYGCPEQAALLEGAGSTRASEAAIAFDDGKFKSAVEICQRETDKDRSSAAATECVGLAPAAMILGGAESGGVKMVGASCGRAASAADGGAKLRKLTVVEVTRWLARGARNRMSREQFKATIDQVATACGVNDGQGALKHPFEDVRKRSEASCKQARCCAAT